jgi:uncharacterized membrane protein YheB (UPF0754 family)
MGGKKQMTLTMFVGPVIGAVIGYCTNYIAVKMLFRPLKPIKIGNFQLPFTPGIIPKGRGRLAKALGQAVGGTLLTPSDIENMLLTDEIRGKIRTQITGYLENETRSLKEIATTNMGDESYIQTTDNIKETLTQKILDGIKKMNLGKIIAYQGVDVVKETVAGTMLAMFVSDDLLSSFVGPIEERINAYVEVHGEELVGGLVCEETDAFLENTPNQLLTSISIENQQVGDIIDATYTKIIRSQVTSLLEQANIPAVVERKVNEMDILDIENLVLSVMKKELNSVVSLGAVIGFVIGLLNLLF